MSSTAYEIRMDVLKMAQQMIKDQNGIKRDKILYEISSITNADPVALSEALSKFDTISYNENDLVDKANALYSFVSSNTRTYQIDNKK